MKLSLVSFIGIMKRKKAAGINYQSNCVFFDEAYSHTQMTGGRAIETARGYPLRLPISILVSHFNNNVSFSYYFPIFKFFKWPNLISLTVTMPSKRLEEYLAWIHILGLAFFESGNYFCENANFHRSDCISSSTNLSSGQLKILKSDQVIFRKATK
ncbi:hypothetical protein BD770DRAFT_411835 [Pilaira anomala]|nr:hypothetical protein BD770DRAFT_411835 [Pilaira anomala]